MTMREQELKVLKYALQSAMRAYLYCPTNERAEAAERVGRTRAAYMLARGRG